MPDTEKQLRIGGNDRCVVLNTRVGSTPLSRKIFSCLLQTGRQQTYTTTCTLFWLCVQEMSAFGATMLKFLHFVLLNVTPGFPDSMSQVNL